MSTSSMSDREVHTTRVIAAPREKVFVAWTDPEILARWWGPIGFTNTFHRFELKPEGIWEFTMHGPNVPGSTPGHFNNTCVFKRMKAPGYLEFDHLKEMHFYKAMVTFTEEAEGTRIEWILRFDTAEELAPIKSFIAQANEENLDKLEKECTGRSFGSNQRDPGSSPV
jgi:uncharacterized protein YndB with AHSA1/START domain